MYRNNSDKLLKNNYISIELKGHKKNSYGIGTKVYAYAGAKKFTLSKTPFVDFNLRVILMLHLGLGDQTKLDSIRVIWPDQKVQRLIEIHERSFAQGKFLRTGLYAAALIPMP